MWSLRIFVLIHVLFAAILCMRSTCVCVSQLVCVRTSERDLTFRFVFMHRCEHFIWIWNCQMCIRYRKSQVAIVTANKQSSGHIIYIMHMNRFNGIVYVCVLECGVRAIYIAIEKNKCFQCLCCSVWCGCCCCSMFMLWAAPSVMLICIAYNARRYDN